MSYQTIRIEREARGVAWLWLARPEKHNAMSAEMIVELTQAAEELGGDEGIRAVVLAAEGETFCAGGDLGWMRDQMEADAPTRRREARALAGMLGALDALPKPLIGRVQGNCFGGGVGLVACCDQAFAATPVQMALTETRLGLIPATIGPYVVARTGPAGARRIFFQGARFGTDEALRLDLLAGVVAPADLDAAIESALAPILQTAPGAVARAKVLARRLGNPPSAADIDHSIDELVACWEGREAREGIAAFFDRRKPHWQS
ncbi:crotonase/enoyl-CoA hydratase family protein [Oceanicola sp. S124]|uniref:crotonase/enoyl-CoA hydratase family protein n=1 Tax=Oceanicola sp. S124 TaxID=1042378 RepID=UPI0002559710|nr:crotonase/enoyl-CoA hydratase family protein [Oceanicola sp. S124]